MDDRSFANHRTLADDYALKQGTLGLDAALATDDCPTDLGALADVAISPDNAAVDLGAIVHDGVVTYHAWAAHHHSCLNLHLVAQVDRTVELGVRSDVNAFTHPDIAANVCSERVVVKDLPGQCLGGGPPILADVTDIAPIARGGKAIDG